MARIEEGSQVSWIEEGEELTGVVIVMTGGEAQINCDCGPRKVSLALSDLRLES